MIQVEKAGGGLWGKIMQCFSGSAEERELIHVIHAIHTASVHGTWCGIVMAQLLELCRELPLLPEPQEPLEACSRGVML